MGDNQRVVDQVRALQKGDFEKFLHLVNESGHSSYRWLQNCLTTRDVHDQSLALALKLSEDFLKKIGAGACRVHGGGFRGTIQIFLPDAALAACIRTLEPVFGKGSVRVLSIRSQGTADVLSSLRKEKS
jgi:galactokinase